MKKKELEILLQQVPLYSTPKPELEQYTTPAPIAADILFLAHQFGDIAGKRVLDFGCGSGIFSVGASLIGASEVVGIDVDNSCIAIAKRYAKEGYPNITYIVQDIKDVSLTGDTVLMNPPFGAQKQNLHADRKFIEKGFEAASIIYSLHLSSTLSFINHLIEILGGKVLFMKEYIFPIKWMHRFHEKDVLKYHITLLRICTVRE